jgi:RHS repeat-associated protein
VLGNRQSVTEITSGAVSGAADPLKIPIDPNGNLTSKTEGTDTWTYEWNAEDELTRVLKNSIEQARFSYDPLGRRVEKVVGGEATNYAYDSANIVREIRGAVTRKYVQGRGADQPYAVDDGSAVTYFHADATRSIVKVTDSLGAVVSARQYDAWGNLDGGSTVEGYAFTGREWDPEARLYYYRARYYDANAGRFISADTAGFDAGLNQYAYVDDNPVNFIDPTGHYTFTPEVDFQGWWNDGGKTAIENAKVGFRCYPSCGGWRLSFQVGLRIRARYSKFCPWFSKPHEQRHIDQAIANVKGMADRYLAPRETSYGSAAECFAAGREGKRAFDAAPDAEFNRGQAEIDHYIPCVMQL